MIIRAKKILFDIENSEHTVIDSSPSAPDKDTTGKGHEQLNLFRKPDRQVIDRLQKIDISKMTPLDALNFLNELQEKAKNVCY